MPPLLCLLLSGLALAAGPLGAAATDSWSAQTAGTYETFTRVHFQGDQFLAFTDQGRIYRSELGQVWTEVPTGLPGGQILETLVTEAGFAQILSNPEASLVGFSEDGLAWQVVFTGAPGLFYQVRSAEDGFVIQLQGAQNGYELFSPNGRGWTIRPGPPVLPPRTAAGLGLFVQIEDYLWEDPNPTTPPPPLGPPTGRPGSRFRISTDLENWEPLVPQEGDHTLLSGIAFGNGRFLATGLRQALVSEDGRNWRRTASWPDFHLPRPMSPSALVKFQDGLFRVLWHNPGGAPGTTDRPPVWLEMTTVDGETWSEATVVASTPSTPKPALSPAPVVAQGPEAQVQVAVPESGGPVLEVNLDGTNWVGVELASGRGEPNSVAYGNGAYVAVGSEGFIRTWHPGLNLPDAPVLEPTERQTDRIEVRWNAVPGAVRYLVYGDNRLDRWNPNTAVLLADTTATSHVDEMAATDPESWMRYYWVRAVDDAGQASHFSDARLLSRALPNEHWFTYSPCPPVPGEEAVEIWVHGATLTAGNWAHDLSAVRVRPAWFEEAMIGAYPWIWTAPHGWWYEYRAPATSEVTALAAAGAPESLWFYDLAYGWLATTPEAYPFLYAVREANWIYYARGTAPRQVYHFASGEWDGLEPIDFFTADR